MTDSPLRRELRAATQTEHRALEAQPSMRALVSPSVTLTDYRRVLAAHHRFFSRWEPALQAVARRLRERYGSADYRYRPRLPALEADLRALAGDLDAPMQAVAEPPLAYGLGMLYVVEGASLGSRPISRHLRRRLGLSAGNGARFYAEAAAGDDWQAFCAWLAGLPEVLNGPQSRAGARDTFTGIGEQLRQSTGACA